MWPGSLLTHYSLHSQASASFHHHRSVPKKRDISFIIHHTERKPRIFYSREREKKKGQVLEREIE